MASSTDPIAVWEGSQGTASGAGGAWWCLVVLSGYLNGVCSVGNTDCAGSGITYDYGVQILGR